MNQLKPPGEWLSVADPDERYTALPLERRVGGGHGSDGVRAEISLE